MGSKIIKAVEVYATNDIKLLHASLPKRCMEIESYGDSVRGEIEIYVEFEGETVAKVCVPYQFDDWTIWAASISKDDMQIALWRGTREAE